MSGGRVEPLWEQVDKYFEAALAPSDDALDAALSSSAAAGLPAIAVSPNLGKLLQVMAQIRGARRILEIGTLGGYSTIWMARALPQDGKLVTLEISRKHADVARRNFERAGLSDRIEVIVAPATETLARLAKDKAAPFDLVFIDADKQNSENYFRASLALSRPGTIIVVDNVVRHGEVIDATSRDVNVKGIRALTEYLKSEQRVSSSATQTVGSKGYDGLIVAVVA